MKKINLYIIIIFVLAITIGFPQSSHNSDYLSIDTYTVSDSSLLNYFPLHKGNIWQYRYNDGYGGWIENMVSYGDTILPNGLTYVNMHPAPYGPVRIKY
jgi:hypothetical protein